MQTYLLNDIKCKLQTLTLQHWNKMSKENWQMFKTIAEWNKNSHLQGERSLALLRSCKQPKLSISDKQRYKPHMDIIFVSKILKSIRVGK